MSSTPDPTEGNKSPILEPSASCSLNAPPRAGSASDMCSLTKNEAYSYTTASAREQEELTAVLHRARDWPSAWNSSYAIASLQ